VILGARVLAEFGADRNRFADAKARKNYAGTSPITRASGTRKVVLARYARNERLGDAVQQWAFGALKGKTTRRRQADGSVLNVRSPRRSATNCLATVRAFYLDIAQWATDDPARWGPWAAPCPIKANEIPHRKEADRPKSRMDQRTRERLPVLPALIAATERQRTASAQRLTAARAARKGPLVRHQLARARV
jgi:hypothetical protein